jgi:hypothetical protein
MSTAELQQRIETLEQEVVRLKAKVEGKDAGKPWWEQIAGTFANDPAFLEAMRLGREYRESLRPKPAKQGKRQDGRPGHRSR